MEQGSGSIARGALLAVAIFAFASGGCAGSPFATSADSGAAGSGGSANTGGAGDGGSQRSSGGHATGGMSSSGGEAQQSGGGTTGGATGGVPSIARGGSDGGAGAAAALGGSVATGGGGGGAGNSTLGGEPALPEVPVERLVLWLAADRGVTQSEGAVSKWLDQSPSRAHATQVTSSARPKLKEAENGLPVLEFDGKDDSLAIPEGFADFTTGVSYFAVVRLLEDSYCTSITQFSNGPEVQDIEFGRFHGSIHYEVANDYITGPTDAFALDKTTLLGYVHGLDETAELRIDGQFMAAGRSMLPEVIARKGNFVGRSMYSDCQYLHGQVAEILLYARPLDSAERVLVEHYLSEKWGCCSM